MDTQVRIILHPSKVYVAVLIALACTLIMAMSALPIATGWRWGGYLCVSAASAWLLARDALMLAGRSCISFSCGKDRHIALVLRNGGKISGELCADTLVSPWLVLLNMAADHHGRQSLVLFPDAMTGEDFRRLRVLLRNSR